MGSKILNNLRTRWQNWPNLILVMALATLAGCATVKKLVHYYEDPSVSAAQHGPALYQKGRQELEDGAYEQAETSLREFLASTPNSPFTLVAHYNLGRALEEQKKWELADGSYREVIAGAQNLAPKLQTMALYRRSFCLQALNQDAAVVATLNDVYVRRNHLGSQEAVAQLPARMAAAYARVGNFEESVRFFTEAEKGIDKLRRETGGEVPSWLAQTFYLMGRTGVQKPNWESFSSSVRPMHRAQKYLVQAIESGVAPWHDLAAVEFMDSYQRLWQVIENSKPMAADEDALLQARSLQERRWQMAAELLESLRISRTFFVPLETGPSPTVVKVLTFEGELESKLQETLREQLVGAGPTPESVQRRERVQGKVVAPTDELERTYRAKRKKPLAKESPHEKSAPPAPAPASEDAGDPNL